MANARAKGSQSSTNAASTRITSANLNVWIAWPKPRPARATRTTGSQAPADGPDTGALAPPTRVQNGVRMCTIAEGLQGTYAASALRRGAPIAIGEARRSANTHRTMEGGAGGTAVQAGVSVCSCSGAHR